MVSSTKVLSFFTIALGLWCVEGSVTGLVPAGKSPNLDPKALHTNKVKRKEHCGPNDVDPCIYTAEVLYNTLKIQTANMGVRSSYNPSHGLFMRYGEIYDSSGKMVATESYVSGRLIQTDVYTSYKRMRCTVTQVLTIDPLPEMPTVKGDTYTYPLTMNVTVVSPDNNHEFSFKEVWTQSRSSATVSFQRILTSPDNRVVYTFIFNTRVLVHGSNYRFFVQYGFEFRDRNTGDYITNISTPLNQYWPKV